MANKISLRDAVYLLGLNFPTTETSVNVVCPVCGKSNKSKKLNLDYQTNVYHCPKCDLGGGVLDFWAFFRGITAATKSELYRLAAIDIGKNQEGAKSKPIKEMKVEKRVDVDAAPLAVRSKTYKGLLKHLTLTENHRNELKRRGLSDTAIVKGQYRSYPLVNLSGIAASLLSEGYVLDGVPGFYKKNDKWTMLEMTSGIFIPVMTGLVDIQGFQLRRDTLEKEGDVRYLTWSTKFKTAGACSKAYVHFSKGVDENYREVILTEGPLKANIITEFTGVSVIGIPGVNSVSFLPTYLDQLKAKGLEKIYIAFDMDLYTNKYVRIALEKIKEILNSRRIRYSTLEWDHSYKGYDDYLLASKKV
ncbi:MAG: DUF3854 domain-containing protein [Eubacteriales bacterium]|nr:DUF3854 domain-containing protein [Eubacteriales bacterium]